MSRQISIPAPEVVLNTSSENLRIQNKERKRLAILDRWIDLDQFDIRDQVRKRLDNGDFTRTNDGDICVICYMKTSYTKDYEVNRLKNRLHQSNCLDDWMVVEVKHSWSWKWNVFQSSLFVLGLVTLCWNFKNLSGGPYAKIKHCLVLSPKDPPNYETSNDDDLVIQSIACSVKT